MAKNSTDTVESLLERGLAALDAGDFEEALAQWNGVLRQDPDNARARRLVSDLQQLINDNRSGAMTPGPGEFVVVPDGEIGEDLESNGGAKGYLERVKMISDEALADNAALTSRLSEVLAELAETKRLLSTREVELASIRQGALEVEHAKDAIEVEKQDLTRFRRQHELQAAELNLRLAERTASERRLLADIEKLAAERDGLKVELDSANARVAQLGTELTELDAAKRKAEGDQEKLRDELEETRNALTSERASQVETQAFLQSAKESVSELETRAEAGVAEVEELKQEAEKLLADKEGLEVDNGRLETLLEEANGTATQTAAEITRLTAALSEVSAEADERVNGATAALEESKAARSAMRAELATIVQDLEQAKTREHDLGEQLAATAAEVSVAQQAASQAQATSAESVAEVEQRVVALSAEIETLNASAGAAIDAASTIAGLEKKLEDLVVLTESQSIELAANALRIIELESLETVASPPPLLSLQAKNEGLQVAFSATEASASSATDEGNESHIAAESLRVSPLDSYVPGGNAASSQPESTPADGLRVVEQLAASEASANEPLIPVDVPSFERTAEQSAALLDSSAVSRLKDDSLSPSDRLRWLVDEQPYVANTAGIPGLSARAAFVLQNIDGSVSFADLIDIVGLPEAETYSILLDLWERGVITSPSLEP